jgi:hypothetical protein
VVAGGVHAAQLGLLLGGELGLAGRSHSRSSSVSRGVRLGFGLRTAVRALASRVIARSIGTLSCAGMGRHCANLAARTAS